MSTLVYAQRISCDWPGCQSVAEMKMPASSTHLRVMPAGWVDLRPYIVRADGRIVGEVCTIHARATVEDLAAILRGGS